MSEKDVTPVKRTLSKNVLWNIFGAVIPLAVAVVTIPILIENLGAARFGMLTIFWMVVGYFSLFDLGLGRALTRLVSSNIGKGRQEENPTLIWTALLMMIVFGLVGTIILAMLSPWLITDVLNTPLELQTEGLDALYLLSLSLPIVISASGLIGILEAHQHFKLINLVRIPLGVMTFLGPALVLHFSNSLIPMIWLLIAVRLVAWCIYLYSCLHRIPDIKKTFSISRRMSVSLLGFGGWMTVSNIIGPIMVYMDRLIIGATITMAAVAYYATPYEVVTKLWIIPGALMSVLFPAISKLLEHDHNRVIKLFHKAVNYLVIILFPITLIIITFSHDVLTHWINQDFAENSSLVLQVLALAVFINSFAQLAFATIQGAGRPDITAKLHLLELPFYLLLLMWMLDSYGIVGAAVAWMVRIVFDTLVLFAIASRILAIDTFFTLKAIILITAVLATFSVSFIITAISLKFVYVLITLGTFSYISWHFLLTEKDKDFFRRKQNMVV